MSFRKVILFSDQADENWETSLLRGALWYHRIPSQVLDFSQCAHTDGKALCVFVPTFSGAREQHSFRWRGDGVIVRAGRRETLDYLRGRISVRENEVVIYGEPYALLARLAKDSALLEGLKGKAVLGSLLNPYEYRTLRDEDGNKHPSFLMTSIGCGKKCGYCSYGATYASLYGKGFARRSRPWQHLEEEITVSMERGVSTFVLTADQFLSQKAEENQELFCLARNWKRREDVTPTLVFTVSPLEVLMNRRLIEQMADSFMLQPHLSVDSFDDATLKLLDLGFNSATALEAARFLCDLGLSFRINYLLVRPGATVNALAREFSCFVHLAGFADHLSSSDKMLIAHDLLFGNLRIMEGSPIELKDGIEKSYHENLPANVLQIIVRVRNAFREFVETSPNDLVDPILFTARTGLRRASRGRAGK